ncbi:MAG: chorismate mutase [Stellaceae bacterium]
MPTPCATGTMPDIPPDLEELRRRLDDLDDRLHDLLIERTEIVGQVAAQKRGGSISPYQPGREALILRRLAARRPGRFPLATLLRMWREMLAATVRQQSPFAVAVFALDETQGFWDLARDHYGSSTPMSAHRSASQVIRAVGEDEAAVGVLPMPSPGDPDPWWRSLLSADARTPRVIARLPFGPRGNARGDADALVIGFAAPQETGADRTLLIVETAPDISRARILALLARRHLACTLFAACEETGGALALIELDGFIPAADPRLAGFAALLGQSLHRLRSLGSYPVPLAAAVCNPAKG